MLAAQPLRNGEMFSIPCDAKVSNVAFSIGGKDLELELEDLIVDRQGKVCLLGLEPYDFPMWILGDVFMRKFYVQFDWGRKRMGFALAANSGHGGASGANSTNNLVSWTDFLAAARAHRF